MTLIRGLSLLFAVLGASCAGGPDEASRAEEPRDPASVRFVVTAPDDRGPLFLSGPFNEWHPSHPAWRLDDEGSTAGARWSIVVDRERLGTPPIELKFTRGSWRTVEVDADLVDRPNRSLDANALAGDVALTIAAWSDDRRTTSTVTGRLDIFDIASERLGNTRKLRVWLPPDYDAPGNLERHYPVLYLNDGQNVFDVLTSFGGAEWRADETATRLIEAGAIGPLIVVAIDNAGEVRTAEYNPPFTKSNGRFNRGHHYLDFVIETVMPAIEERYRVARGPDNTAFGGSSYGANIALYAALRHPELFGALLVESPAAWAFGDRLLDRCAELDEWPARVFVAVGTDESINAAFQEGYERTADVLRATFEAAGMGPDRARVIVEEGGRHSEAAWARRLPGALEFLFGR